jgi:hypothetical protein
MVECRGRDFPVFVPFQESMVYASTSFLTLRSLSIERPNIVNRKVL